VGSRDVPRLLDPAPRSTGRHGVFDVGNGNEETLLAPRSILRPGHDSAPLSKTAQPRLREYHGPRGRGGPLAALDGPLVLEHESELDEELSRGREVVNHDADVIHPLDSHVLDGKEPDSGRALDEDIRASRAARDEERVASAESFYLARS
jgi:hypothetical protein